jgi:hypothetical protein
MIAATPMLTVGTHFVLRQQYQKAINLLLDAGQPRVDVIDTGSGAIHFVGDSFRVLVKPTHDQGRMLGIVVHWKASLSKAPLC